MHNQRTAKGGNELGTASHTDRPCRTCNQKKLNQVNRKGEELCMLSVVLPDIVQYCSETLGLRADSAGKTNVE
jgi:hypothetical protein